MLNDFIHMTQGELCMKHWWIGVGLACIILLMPYLLRAFTWAHIFAILWWRNWKKRREYQ